MAPRAPRGKHFGGRGLRPKERGERRVLRDVAHGNVVPEAAAREGVRLAVAMTGVDKGDVLWLRVQRRLDHAAEAVAEEVLRGGRGVGAEDGAGPGLPSVVRGRRGVVTRRSGGGSGDQGDQGGGSCSEMCGVGGLHGAAPSP